MVACSGPPAAARLDLEIIRGYVPGYNGVLGHEFVGTVVAYGPPPPAAAAGSGADTGSWPPPSTPLGTRVVGEINCNDAHYTCADAVFQRNHAPGRSVLGIIGRDGCLAQYTALPALNLHVVPPGLSDAEAVFAEPLAAACRIPEQGLPRQPGSDRVAVIGDGKLGLLTAAVLSRHLAAAGGHRLTLVGRHDAKMALVPGDLDRVVSEGDGSAVAERLGGQFDLVVEASGSAHGIRTALALCRPLGTVLLKSTVSTLQPPAAPATATTAGSEQGQQQGPAAATAAAPTWAELANDIVVNEKVLVGSRCGPFDAALQLMAGDEGVRRLLRSMVAAELQLAAAGTAALERAASKGTLKVQVVM
eukprot:XP_001691240.1 predicted protein [Chlamydomonas reinhardtii]